MNTSIITDTISDLSLPSIPTPDISVPDIDTDAVVSWTRRVLPFVGKRSFVRRHLLSLGVIAAVGVAAFVIVSRKRSDDDSSMAGVATDDFRRVA